MLRLGRTLPVDLQHEKRAGEHQNVAHTTEKGQAPKYIAQIPGSPRSLIWELTL